MENRHRNVTIRHFSTFQRILIIIGIIALIAVVNLVVTFFPRRVKAADARDGVSYVQNLEEADTASLEEELKVLDKNKRQEVLAKASLNGETSVWSMFDDIVLMGDSRTSGFWMNDFLDHSQVLAEYAYTIYNIKDYEDDLVALNPSYVILQYGMDERWDGFFVDVYDFMDTYDEIIGELQELLPNTTFIVQSIIEAIDPAFERTETFRDLPEWNAAMKEHYTEIGIPYIDISTTVESFDGNPYSPGGFHMSADFYESWAIRLLVEVEEL